MKKSRPYFTKYLGTACRSILVIIAFLSVTNCIEPYEFVVKNDEPTLVVQGYISDKSFTEATQYPSEGRFFNINLSYTDDVSDTRGQNVNNAEVRLVDDQGNSWLYTEAQNVLESIYQLCDVNFKALADRSYQLQITLENQEQYNSSWVRMPTTPTHDMGTIGFTEDTIQAYVYISGKEDIRTIKGLNAIIDLPKNNEEQPIYYKWFYDPIWIYKTPLRPDTPNTPTICWAKNPNFLNSYDVAEDFLGDHEETLFFMETEGNERIYDQLSVLITQQVLNKEHFFFWKELQEQAGNSMLFDKLPYNLATNIKAVNGTKSVSGYFDVVKEKAVRWYFNKEALSYPIEHNLAENCIKYRGRFGPAPECSNCLLYTHGVAVAEAPSWWDPK